jgi:hypothetical protein
LFSLFFVFFHRAPGLWDNPTIFYFVLHQTHIALNSRRGFSHRVLLAFPRLSSHS